MCSFVILCCIMKKIRLFIQKNMAAKLTQKKHGKWRHPIAVFFHCLPQPTTVNEWKSGSIGRDLRLQ